MVRYYFGKFFEGICHLSAGRTSSFCWSPGLSEVVQGVLNLPIASVSTVVILSQLFATMNACNFRNSNVNGFRSSTEHPPKNIYLPQCN